MRIRIHDTATFFKAVVLGVGVSVLVSLVMVPLTVSGLSPFPQPVAVAFVKQLFGSGTPLPVGLLFHVLYVTFWSVVFVALYRANPTILRAGALAAVLWVIVLVVIFPFVGWGIFGSVYGITAAVFVLIPHALFAILVSFGTRRFLTPGVPAIRREGNEQPVEE